MRIRRAVTAIICAVLPPVLKPPVLRLLGHRVAPGARIGASFVFVGCLVMERGSRIGHANLIRVFRLTMRSGAYIGAMNVIRGPMSIRLASRAAIGNRCIVVRSPVAALVGPSRLRLGELSKLTAGHYIDCTASITVGAFSILAGHGSQVWTHGYVHDAVGPGRARVDGEVIIGNNVFVGSHSCISAGTRIGDSIAVASHSSVAGHLAEPGHYVSQRLRRLERHGAERLADLEHVTDGPPEVVYRKSPRAAPLST